jgi:hypothetical protein
MSTIPVTVKTADKTFKKNVDLPLDMLIGDVRDQFLELARLSSVPCDLVLDRKDQILPDTATVQSAGIQPGDSLTVAAKAEGG